MFFDVVGKEPADVTPRDVFAFVTSQQRPRPGAENLVRISDGGSGLSAATIRRLLAAVSSLFGYLIVRYDTGMMVNPVPRGVPTRRSRHRGVPLVRGVLMVGGVQDVLTELTQLAMASLPRLSRDHVLFGDDTGQITVGFLSDRVDALLS